MRISRFPSRHLKTALIIILFIILTVMYYYYDKSSLSHHGSFNLLINPLTRIIPLIKIIDNTEVFRPVAITIYETLKSLGIKTELVENIDPSDENSTIYIGFLFYREHERVPKHYIIYNWEPYANMKGNGLSDSEFSRQRYRDAIEVWDYSYLNIEHWKSIQVKHIKYMPVVYNPIWETPPKNMSFNSTHLPHSDIDLLFFGYYRNPNNHRQRTLNIFREYFDSNNKNDSFVMGQFSYEDLLKKMSVSMIGLNVHQEDDPSILEVHRCVQLMSNGLYVLSERSSDTLLDSEFSPFIDFFDKDNAIEKLNNILDMGKEEVQRIAKERYELFKARPGISHYLKNSVLYRLSNNMTSD